MKKNIVQALFIHSTGKITLDSFSDKISEFHVAIIRRSLHQSNLTIEEKIFVIDQILKNLKAAEANDTISPSS